MTMTMDRYLSNEAATRTLNTTGDWNTHERIRATLHQQTGAWVCASAFLEAHMPTYSQRIGEMVKRGDPIDRGRCNDPAHHHRSSVAAYRWIPETWEGRFIW